MIPTPHPAKGRRMGHAAALISLVLASEKHQMQQLRALASKSP
jgi:hypothetical protein